MRAAGALLVLACLSGCGTVINLAWGARETGPLRGLDAETAIYGGIQIDVRAVGEGIRGDEGFAWSVFATVLGVLDFPLSFLADTLTLPYTVPLELLREEKTPPASRGSSP